MLILVLATAGIAVGILSRYTLLTALLDGLSTVLILTPFLLGGLCLVPFFRLRSLPTRWHLILGPALGLGAAALGVLSLGLAGLLSRTVWFAAAAACGVLGGMRLRSLVAARPGREEASPSNENVRFHFLWLLIVPFFILALLAAANAPGYLWSEEGFGYDVLEYHLQLPKEYHQTGVIRYLAHNVYANFPSNVEMLYLLAIILLRDVFDVGTTANMIHLVLGALSVAAAWVIGREWSPRAGVLCAVTLATTGWLPYLAGLAYVEHGVLLFGMLAAGATWRMRETDRAQGRRGWSAIAGVLAGLSCGCKYTAVPMIALPLGLAALLPSGASIRSRLADAGVFALSAVLTFAPWIAKNLAMTGNPVFPLLNSVFRSSPPGWGEEETSRWNRAHEAAPAESSLAAKGSALWQRVPGDHYQRFGPALFLLAIGGLPRRRLTGADAVLILMLVAQSAVWLLSTHLYARFAVPMLIPLTLLAGRSVLGSNHARRLVAIVAVLILGAGWNLFHAVRLTRAESPLGAPASLMYDGRLPEYAYFAVVNHELPERSRILLVGDARAFYFRRAVDYCVVFNRSPFLEAVRQGRTADELTEWLRRAGYTHVLVNWSEVRRLSRTYGFAEEVTPELFNGLMGHGLRLIHEFRLSNSRDRCVDLYEIIGPS